MRKIIKTWMRSFLKAFFYPQVLHRHTHEFLWYSFSLAQFLTKYIFMESSQLIVLSVINRVRDANQLPLVSKLMVWKAGALVNDVIVLQLQFRIWQIFQKSVEVLKISSNFRQMLLTTKSSDENLDFEFASCKLWRRSQ